MEALEISGRLAPGGIYRIRTIDGTHLQRIVLLGNSNSEASDPLRERHLKRRDLAIVPGARDLGMKRLC